MLPMADSEEHATGNARGASPLVLGIGGFLTVVTGVAVAVLAFVLVSTAAGGDPGVATLSLLGIVVGIVIYYAGMDELLQNGP